MISNMITFTYQRLSYCQVFALTQPLMVSVALYKHIYVLLLRFELSLLSTLVIMKA